ncbi:SDR family oxidoreductase [Alicyclobacillus suci]|uniref:SDR family oxidoreductase n=1 Tax=Alicyclobacillus suci TaxID=2816080 RepID=UPI001F475DC9|nr:SDR family oxidoreductase [Alicyclobacillus suci]
MCPLFDPSTKTEEQTNIPLGRYGTVDEFAKLAVFILSSANSYMTGQTILTDGGKVLGI